MPRKKHSASPKADGSSSPKAIDPTALSPGQLAELLTKAGGKTIDAAAVVDDVACGAPSNADNTMHLVRYTAWLAAQAD